jgi:RimJ/RimL family protein N-acetyltransferase
MNSTKSEPADQINIRLAAPQDAKLVRELRLEALAMHLDAFAADYDLTKAEGAEVWAERISSYAENKTSTICIAEAQETMIGMTGIGRGHWPKTNHFGTIWGVYVKPGWRGHHIAERLINGCIEWAKDNGISMVNLGVNVSNIAAIRCYSRCGFTVYGIEPKTIFYQGVYIDELLMYKQI